ncbi:MAG: flagellar hook-associated protein 3 [Frankiales bacterium]|nr:flagellar hook-associated protein 3 [Frankiales bacterium]
MRVSTISTYLTTSQSLGGALERVQNAQAQIASGKVLTRWSDDASAAAAAERYRAQESDWTSYQRSGTDAQSWLGAADGALQSMSSILSRVKELTVSATSGALTGSSRTAIADEVDQLRTELKDLGNTTHLGRSLFGGFAATALTSASDGTVTFAGDGGNVQRQVSPTTTLTVNVSAKDVFGFNAGPGQDLFSTLTTLSTAVRAGDSPGLANIQTALASRQADVLHALGTVGSTTNRVDNAYASGSVALQDLASRRSNLEDVDLASAVLTLNQAQAGYTAALGAASRANLPSLADFLK